MCVRIIAGHGWHGALYCTHTQCTYTIYPSLPHTSHHIFFLLCCHRIGRTYETEYDSQRTGKQGYEIQYSSGGIVSKKSKMPTYILSQQNSVLTNRHFCSCCTRIEAAFCGLLFSRAHCYHIIGYGKALCGCMQFKNGREMPQREGERETDLSVFSLFCTLPLSLLATHKCKIGSPQILPLGETSFCIFVSPLFLFCIQLSLSFSEKAVLEIDGCGWLKMPIE